jgi:hypothetical protein
VAFTLLNFKENCVIRTRTISKPSPPVKSAEQAWASRYNLRRTSRTTPTVPAKYPGFRQHIKVEFLISAAEHRAAEAVRNDVARFDVN